MGFCLLAAALCLLPDQASLAQNPAPQESRYCTWLFWSKEPALIKQALERMAQGDPFMVVARDLARKNPKDSQANADCMQAAGMDPAVLAVVKNLQIGEISRPFDLGGGTALVMRTTDQYRRKAQEYYSKGRYSQAERELLRDLKLHPASAAAWHMLALTRTAQGNYKLALTALDKALAWSPGNPAMLNDKASALANLGRGKEAVTVFEKALKLDPKNPTIMSNLAWALTLTKQKPKRAEALAREACQVAPREARYWHTLGKIQAEHGKHGEAVASLRQALMLEPKNKAIGLDLISSVKALDPKVLARLSQAAPPPAAKPEPEPKSKDKADEIGKGLKRAPDLSGPAIALPSQWPSQPKAKADKKPAVKTTAQAKSPQVTKAKPEAKPESKPGLETKPEPPAEHSSGASGRIVSLPMPKFPEQPPKAADKEKESEVKAHAFQESPKPAPAKAGPAAEAETGVTGQDKPKPATAETEPPKTEPEKPKPGTEPGKAEPVAKAEPAIKDEPEKAKAETKAAPIPEKAEERAKAKSKLETKPAKDEPEKAKDETKPAETKAAAESGQIEAPAGAKADTKSKTAADKPEKDKPTPKADITRPTGKTEPDTKPKPAKDESGKPESRPDAKTETEAAPDKPKPGPGEPVKARPQTAPEPSKDVKTDKPHYLIQVASYRPESLATKELRAWQGRKLSGHIEKWQDKRGRTWHRVLLGPFADEKEAEKKAKELKAKRLVRDYYVVKRPAD